MTKTTDNVQPIGRESFLTDKNGRISEEAHNFMTAVRDQSLGKNRVSDKQSFESHESLSDISELLRIEGTNGETKLTSNPQIKTTFDGRKLTLEGMSDDNPLIVGNGNGVLLKNKDQLLLKNNQTADFHYNKEKDLWIEQGKQNVPNEQIMSATSTINPAAIDDLIRIKSAGGGVPLTSDPQILPSYDGRKITIEGLDNTDYITLKQGYGVQLKNADIDFKEYITATLHYNKSKDLWIEN